MLKLICATKCSNIYMHPQIHNQDSLHFTLTLAILPGAALPHLKRGTAALKPRHCHDLSDRWGWGGIYTLPPQRLSSSFCSFQLIQNRKWALSLSPSLPPLVILSPQANPLISPSILEKKGSKTRLESSSIDFQTLKSTWFTFWPAVVFVTLGAWLIAG